jgi:hypothetical protein
MFRLHRPPPHGLESNGHSNSAWARHVCGTQGLEAPVDGYAMPHPRRPEVPARHAWGRVPLGALAVLALFLAAGPIGLALSHDRPRPTRSGLTLGDLARKAGCRLHEYESGRVTNPPITGRLMEQAIATDGSHIGRRTPSLDATTHSLLHGRVLIQYRPGIPEAWVRALDQLVKGDPDRVLGFANQTGMKAPVAATAYLSLLTCPRVNVSTLQVLRVFRDRRRGFGSAF